MGPVMERYRDISRCYEILGLKPSATPDQVKQAYRDLCKVWHPDRFGHDPRLQQKAQEKLKEINEAYEHLRNYRPSRQAPRPTWHPPPPAPEPGPPGTDSTWGGAERSDVPKAPPDVAEPPSKKSGIPSWITLLVAIIVMRLVSSHLGCPHQSTPTKVQESRPTNSSATQPINPKSQTPLPYHLPSLNRAASRRKEVQTSGKKGTPIPERGSANLQQDHDYSRALTARTLGYFTVGSTRDDVLRVQGTPTEFNDKEWKYGLSSVYFSGDRVETWDISPVSPLKARMLPSRPVEPILGYFTVGSTKDEVLAVQGTPTEFNERVWKYGLSSVYFSGGRVKTWDISPVSPLNARMVSTKATQ